MQIWEQGGRSRPLRPDEIVINGSSMMMNAMTVNTTVYRGGSSLEPRDIDVKVDPKTGLVQPGRGISLSSEAADWKNSEALTRLNLFHLNWISSSAVQILLILR